MIRMFDQEMEKDLRNPAIYRPIVAIGHTKDLVDLDTIESFLSYLRAQGVFVSTFRDVHDRIMRRGERS
jgi:cysteinyl-tRNA synthetase